jgi:hypothetical protein
MANVQGLCSSFKSEIMLGAHQLGSVTIVSRTSLTSPTTDTLKAALYLVSASHGVADTAYSATGRSQRHELFRWWRHRDECDRAEHVRHDGYLDAERVDCLHDGDALDRL